MNTHIEELLFCEFNEYCSCGNTVKIDNKWYGVTKYVSAEGYRVILDFSIWKYYVADIFFVGKFDF